MRHMAKRVCGMTGEATPAQIDYAKKISEAFGVEPPKKKTKQAYGDFIAKYSAKYKKAEGRVNDEYHGRFR